MNKRFTRFSMVRFTIAFSLFVFLLYLIFFVVNPIRGLGYSIRILFIHVPSAWIAVVSFTMSLYFSIKYLKTNRPHNFEVAHACTVAGVVLIVLATLSGALWAKITWNSFWNWDPRQTTITFLLLIYISYFAIRYSFTNKHTLYRVSSVYLIFSGLTVPLFVFVVPRLYFTLHPSPITGRGGSFTFDNTIKITLFFSVVFSSWLFIEYLIYSIRRITGNSKGNF